MLRSCEDALRIAKLGMPERFPKRRPGKAYGSLPAVLCTFPVLSTAPAALVGTHIRPCKTLLDPDITAFACNRCLP